jgi:hypothetical protein
MGLEGRSTVSLFLGMRACRYRTGGSKSCPASYPMLVDRVGGPTTVAQKGRGPLVLFWPLAPSSFKKAVFERDISFIA